MSELSKTLEELLKENKLDCKTFASRVGISASSITQYMRNDKLPSVANLIKIAEYFNCSTDFLLGREYEVAQKSFNPPVPFAERIVYLRNYFNCKPSDVYNASGITKSRYFEWVNGKRQPSLDNIIRLADLFECRVDFILGREV